MTLVAHEVDNDDDEESFIDDDNVDEAVHDDVVMETDDFWVETDAFVWGVEDDDDNASADTEDEATETVTLFVAEAA